MIWTFVLLLMIAIEAPSWLFVPWAIIVGIKIFVALVG